MLPAEIIFGDVEALKKSELDDPFNIGECFMRPLNLISHEPTVQIIRPSARRQIDGGSGTLRGQEKLHERGHTHACLHIRGAVQTATTLFAKCHWAVFVRT